MFRGGCHCGNITLELTISIEPAAVELRECQCTFCRKHGARTMTPPGRVEIVLGDPALVEKYRFSQRTADFLICRRCGTFVAAVIDDAAATINVNVMEDRLLFVRAPSPVNYDGEDVSTRTARRASRWTPAVVKNG